MCSSALAINSSSVRDELGAAQSAQTQALHKELLI
jgi:hypothetical protein